LLQSPLEDPRRFKGNDHQLPFRSISLLQGCREVILDISLTAVDESKEIVLVEFASLSSNDTLRMTFMMIVRLILS